MSFEDKVILITGASSGIGADCAKYFAKKGALLALVGRNEDRFATVIDGIKEDGVEAEPLVILADVSTDAERIINETIEEYGRLDILINNAAFTILGSIETLKMEDFDAMMATNTRAVVQLTQLAVPYLTETKGNVVNVSSIAGIIPVEGAIGYAMTKAALDYFTKCSAVELAPKGIRVNSVNPGIIDTNFHTYVGAEKTDDIYKGFMEQCAKLHPLKRIGEIEEVVNAIAFLANENSSFITGMIFSVDGGLATKGAFSL